MAGSMTDTPTVNIRGLRDFAREMRQVDRQFPRVMRQAHKSVAGIVVDEAKTIGSRLGGVHAHVVAMNSIRAGGTAKGAKVIMGGTAAKHGPALGAEFGAYPSAFGFIRGPRVRQFPQWRGNAWQPYDGGVGFMVHPAIRQHESRIGDEYWDHVEAAMADAYPTRI